ncbi:hypothetical protein O181_052290 [Austropuccinia psidii MF-1]|uniref:Retrotransposon gag domain-containing protein n=1 Tax=Austropuccinia psidii MF-1 TaxID=1389203 RepID=A0A9Q3HSI4_9BASI|nr:hypothetical protein [Austropuccinia psidii MF-1]
MNSYLQVKKFMGPEKTEELPKGWTLISCKGQVQQIKAWFKSQSMLSEDQKKNLAQGKDNNPVEAPQAFTRRKYASTSAKQAQANPKDQSEGQSKGKGKGKAQVEQALPSELQDSQEREDRHGKYVQYGKNSDGIQKQGRGKVEPIFSKGLDLVKLSTPILDRNVLNLNNDLHHTISSNSEVETSFNFKDIPRLEEWPTFSGEGEYNHLEFMKTTDMFKEDFNIPEEYISARLHSLFTKSAKKWYYKMRQDHAKHSWPWWKEQIVSKWANYSGRFKMENYVEDSILNIKKDRPMSWFLKQKERLTALHPDMSETMVHRRILRKCVGDLDNATRSRYGEIFSTEYYINSMEDIKSQKKIVTNWYQPPIENRISGKTILRPKKPQDRAP